MHTELQSVIDRIGTVLLAKETGAKLAVICVLAKRRHPRAPGENPGAYTNGVADA
ncbi:MAG: hypothetical protein MKZ98_10270 [Pseudomonadales bacterium]|nr:hypothetical protein [Pseudomonadales bacterium]